MDMVGLLNLHEMKRGILAVLILATSWIALVRYGLKARRSVTYYIHPVEE